MPGQAPDVTEDAKRTPDPAGSTLKLDPLGSDEERELDFELRFLKSLTVAQRFELMLQKSREMADLLRSRGHGIAASIAKRT